MRIAFYAPVVLLVLGCACAQDVDPSGREQTPGGSDPAESIDPSRITHVELRFTDSSTPPEWHRSYRIAADAARVDVQVDVYGEVIAQGTYVTDAATWSTLRTSAFSLPKQLSIPDDRGTGISVHTLTLSGEDLSRTLEWSSLMKDEVPGLTAAKAYAAEVKALVPNLDELLATEYTKE